MPSSPWLFRLSTISILLALTVILLGAYTRLSDAGLGCPDWPGCYGQLTAPQNELAIQQAELAYPNSPVDTSKAQIEMTHRYFAESLGLLIFIIGGVALWRKKSLTIPTWLPILLMGLVLFQGLLGMWTVTLQLWPIIVVGHLLGGFSILGLLWLLVLFIKRPTLPRATIPVSTRVLSALMLFVVLVQIFLGGWTSANYAALICPDFPTCQGSWWPHANFKGAFNIFSTMETPARTAVHIAHRLGAMITFFLGVGLIHSLIHTRKKIFIGQAQALIRALTRTFALLLVLQIALGISNVMLFLPLPIAVAHNGVAALLLLVLITLNYVLTKMSRQHYG